MNRTIYDRDGALCRSLFYLKGENMRNPKPKEWLASELSQQYIADYKPFNFVDGEGVRNSLYVSGCPFACEGCFNAASQNFHYGKPFTQEIEDQLIADTAHDYVQGVTFLGGEPFLNTQVCLKVIHRLRSEFGDTRIFGPGVGILLKNCCWIAKTSLKC